MITKQSRYLGWWLFATLPLCACQSDGPARTPPELALNITVDPAVVADGARVSVYRPKLLAAPDPVETLSQGTIADGRYSLTLPANDIHLATVDISDAESGYAVARFDVVVEPGEVTVAVEDKSHRTTSGGRYNDILFEPLLTDKLLLAAIDDLETFAESLPEDADFRDETIRKRFIELNQRRNARETAIREEIALHHSDPVARVLAWGSGYFGNNPEHRLREAEALVEELGSNRQALVNLRHARDALESLATAAEITEGTVIKDFESTDLEGKPYRLAETFAESEYVLVEFWASWCGPCIAEIPHMKQAYSRFNDRGFEIVSFSIDHERDAWVEESVKQQLPWPNLSDLLGRTSPVARMYGVTGVPKNYLVDASSGEIIAIDLRQEALDQKLEELFN